MSIVLCACKNDNNDKDNDGASLSEETVALSKLDMSEYVKLCQYKDLTVSYSDNETKAEAVWKYILENSEIIKYPENNLKYYFNQSKAKYEYIAKTKNDTYENILALLDTNEDEMWKEAENLLAGDLVFYALVDAEGIELRNSEKDEFFERYVDKFVADYGYGEEYVRENMSDEIYETMLRDKTLERLIVLNKFTEG